MRTLIFLSIIVSAFLFGACCGGIGGKCPADIPDERPYGAEFIFSNLCDEGVSVIRLELTAGDIQLIFSAGKQKGSGGEPVGYGDEKYLGEGYFVPGSYRVSVTAGVDVAGKDGEIEITFDGNRSFNGPSTVDITLRKKDGECVIQADVVGDEGGADKCYEDAPEPQPGC